MDSSTLMEPKNVVPTCSNLNQLAEKKNGNLVLVTDKKFIYHHCHDGFTLCCINFHDLPTSTG
jgi:hypothetical protein